MLSFFSTLFLGLIAAVIGATIQERTWRNRALVELKEKEYLEARRAIEELSKAIDKRLTAQRSYTVLVLRRQITEDDIKVYKTATTEWMGEFSSNKSRLHHSFGGEAAHYFEDDVQRSLQFASAVVSLDIRYGRDNLSPDHRILFEDSELQLNFINSKIYKFLNNLNDKIANGEIGRTQAINNIEKNDPAMISRLYLIRRLLGMEGNIRRAY